MSDKKYEKTSEQRPERELNVRKYIHMYVLIQWLDKKNINPVLNFSFSVRIRGRFLSTVFNISVICYH